MGFSEFGTYVLQLERDNKVPCFSVFFVLSFLLSSSKMTVETIQTNAVVFDLDGTLVDTTPQVIKFWTELAKENNIDPAQVRLLV